MSFINEAEKRFVKGLLFESGGNGQASAGTAFWLACSGDKLK